MSTSSEAEANGFLWPKVAGLSSDKSQANRYDDFLNRAPLKTKLTLLAAICGLSAAGVGDRGLLRPYET